MDILAEANRLKATGVPVVSMAVGQPSDPAPIGVREAAANALKTGRIGYTDALGLAGLRKAIAEHYAEHYGIDVSPNRIAVTTGSSAAFNLAFLAMFDPGDRVAIAAPGYPAYRNIMAALGIEIVEIELDGAAYLHAEHVKTAHREKPLKGVLFASPANPTGAVIPADQLSALVTTAEELGIAVISDEIYHRLAYAAPDTTALAYGASVTVINSFSKYYCMTGWRIGWMVLPEELVRPVERIAQSLYISAAGTLPDRCDGSFQGDGGTGSGEGALRLEPRASDETPAGARLYAGGPHGRRLLCLSATSPGTPTTAWHSRARCWPRRMWRRRPAATSTPWPGTGRCVFPMRAAMMTWSKRWRASSAG